MNKKDLGPDWKGEGSGENRQAELQRRYAEIFRRRTGLTDGKGEYRQIHEDVAGTEVVFDEKNRPQVISRSDKTDLVLACGCLVREDTKVKRTPFGHLQCSDHWHVCSLCGQVIEPVPKGQEFCAIPLKRYFHRHPCALKVLDSLFLDLRLGKKSEISQDELAQLRFVLNELKEEKREEKRQLRRERQTHFIHAFQNFARRLLQHKDRQVSTGYEDHVRLAQGQRE